MHAMAGLEEGLADDPRPAPRIQHQRAGRQRRERDQPRQGGPIGLYRRTLESGCLPVERLGQLGIVRRHGGKRTASRPPRVADARFC